jgi:hypothetical protein
MAKTEHFGTFSHGTVPWFGKNIKKALFSSTPEIRMRTCSSCIQLGMDAAFSMEKKYILAFEWVYLRIFGPLGRFLDDFEKWSKTNVVFFNCFHGLVKISGKGSFHQIP